jgi:hypothetical protein
MNNQVNNLNKYVKLNPDTTKYIIIGLVVLCLILFLVFADFSVSVGSTKKQSIRPSALSNKQINSSNTIMPNNRNNLNNSRINMDKLGKNNINDALGAPYAFPPIDRYMSDDLREQIKGLKDKFYYDNCKYGSLL